jgi:hypothetical protein
MVLKTEGRKRMRELLAALWKTADSLDNGALTIWINPGKLSLHMPARNILTLDAESVADLHDIAGNRNVYFGLGLRVEGLDEDRQGGKSEIVAMPGLWLDIDFYNPVAHKALNLPKDLDEASVVLDQMPDPSALIHSGNGVQVGWFFNKPIILDTQTRRTQAQKAYAAWQKPLIDLAAKHGWQLDNTASIQRVWRLPGFTNQKTDKPVELLYCDADVRYEPGELGLNMPAPRSAGEEKPKKKAPAPVPAASELVAEVRSSLARISPNNRYKDAIKAVLKGESMANPGERDRTLQGVCSTIAWFPEGRNADPEELAEVLRPSLQVWADEPGDGESEVKSIEQEMEKAVDKIRRNQEDYHAKQAERLPQLEGIAKALGVSLDGDDRPPNDQIIRHSMIQYRDSYYVYDYRIEQYTGMKTSKEILPLLRDAWEEGPGELAIEYENAKGEIKDKTLARIAKEYCTNTDKVMGDMTLLESSYSAEKRTFYEAVAQRRVTESEYNEEIDTWLRLMVGDGITKDGRQLVDLVLDWIAVVPRLDAQNSALYLDGFSGAGKGLLAQGLARLWHEGPPTEFELITGNFNNDISKCPLLHIDEGLEGQSRDITKKLRAILGRQNFSLNEKNLPTRMVKGAIRLIICANNSGVLNVGDTDYSQRDLEAIVGRILYIYAQKASADWLKARNKNGKLTYGWVDEDGIAKHCLWLYENRVVTPGRRFLVEGDETEMHRGMIMQGDTNSLVYEWIARFASNPGLVYQRYKAAQTIPLAQIGNGEIRVNAECLIECWDCYMKHALPPKSTRIGPALGKLSERVARLGPREDRHRFHVIKPDMIVEWCERHQIGNEDRIADNLEKRVDERNNEETVE